MPSYPELPEAFETGRTGVEALKQKHDKRSDDLSAAGPAAEIQADKVGKAQVDLAPTQGHQATGEVQLVRQKERVHITGEISGLKPGPHGFHIHETGDCSGPDAKSAGGHFAPEGHAHGDPMGDREHHAGDFGNIVANGAGVAEIDLWSDLPLLTEGVHFVVGRAFVVHAGRDDLKTQPSGDAGARVACGAIKTDRS